MPPILMDPYRPFGLSMLDRAAGYAARSDLSAGLQPPGASHQWSIASMPAAIGSVAPHSSTTQSTASATLLTVVDFTSAPQSSATPKLRLPPGSKPRKASLSAIADHRG